MRCWRGLPSCRRPPTLRRVFGPGVQAQRSSPTFGPGVRTRRSDRLTGRLPGGLRRPGAFCSVRCAVGDRAAFGGAGFGSEGAGYHGGEGVATLAARRVVGPATSDRIYPQKCPLPAAVRDHVIFLCSSSSRRCGYVEKRRFPSSARKYSSTGCVENLGRTRAGLWTVKNYPHGLHRYTVVLHRFSTATSPKLGITFSLEMVTRS